MHLGQLDTKGTGDLTLTFACRSAEFPDRQDIVYNTSTTVAEVAESVIALAVTVSLSRYRTHVIFCC